MTRHASRGGRDEAGFTLVETLVSSILIILTLTMTLAVVRSTSHVVGQAQDSTNLNEEARVALDRVARELREASNVTAASNPAPSPSLSSAYASYNANGDVSLTFEADFNGNGVIEADAADPEVVTYKFNHAAGQLLIQAGSQTLPVLAGNVTSFKLTFTSRLTAYDGTVNGTKDGIVTWEELDADPAHLRGNGNKVLDALELRYVDSVGIEMTLFRGTHQQVYRTQVDLRNRPY